MRVLFVTSTRIGDAVQTTGVLDWLAKQTSDARFTIACGPVAAPLFKPFPALERLIVMTKRPASLHWLALWAACVGRRWDLVVDLRGSALAWFLLARTRKSQLGMGLGQHRVRELGALFGLDPPPAPRLWNDATQIRAAAAAIPDGPPVLALGPGANWRAKQWRPERFAELARRLTAPGTLLAGGRVTVFGAAEDHEAALPALAAVEPARRIDLVGKLDLPTVHACLKRCAVFVGNDSGLMHVAAAAGLPTLGLFGPSDERRFAPWGERAAVVRTPQGNVELKSAPGFDHRTADTLMDGLTVERVEEAARALLARQPEPAAQAC